MPGPEGRRLFDSLGTAPVPALRPWHPRDGLAGVEPVNRLQEVLFTDGRWRLVTVKAQGRTRRGWAVLIEYYATGAHEIWVMFDRASCREPFER